MGREELEVLGGGKVKRKTQRRMGLFIDATGLDRATRRLEKKVDLSRLVKGVTAGAKLEIARYYCLIPNEDDARQFSFLDAVERAGIEVVTKRLPPKGVKRQVSMDVHLASDLVSFCHGLFSEDQKSTEDAESAEDQQSDRLQANASGSSASGHSSGSSDYGPTRIIAASSSKKQIRRVATVVCPSRELSYAIYTASISGVETTLADFGLYGSSDGWKGVDKWVDLSTSETIWR